ncbi:unnamed protein product [Calicophoron daubneyi]|uniref:Uncharacterized protein n=1 Tax=Calicophoron daubneyi TaxID=300641 RepID=A0AAV2TT41_CALDB
MYWSLLCAICILGIDFHVVTANVLRADQPRETGVQNGGDNDIKTVSVIKEKGREKIGGRNMKDIESPQSVEDEKVEEVEEKRRHISRRPRVVKSPTGEIKESRLRMRLGRAEENVQNEYAPVKMPIRDFIADREHHKKRNDLKARASKRPEDDLHTHTSPNL